MSKFGNCGEYIRKPCVKCGRHRVEHWSKGFDICEKCGWCEQLNQYINDGDERYFDSCGECKHFDACSHELGWIEDTTVACGDFKPKDGKQE